MFLGIIHFLPQTFCDIHFLPRLFAIYISCPNFLNIQNMPQNNCETPTPRCIEIRPHLRPPEADKTGRRPDTTHNEISIDRLQRLSTRHDRNHTTTSSWCRGHDWGLKRHGVIVTMKGYREEGRVDAAQHAKKDTQRQSDGADEDACVSRFNSERSCLCIVLGNITGE